MLFTATLLSALATLTLAYPFEASKRAANALSACGYTVQNCACPANTTYQKSIASAVYPTVAGPITDISSDFFKSAWFGQSPDKTEGTDNAPGAIRYFPTMLPNGKAPVTVAEQLTSFSKNADGGYTMAFGFANVPFTYPENDGTTGHIGGTWETITVSSDGKTTRFQWDTQLCFSGPWSKLLSSTSLVALYTNI